MSTPTEEPRFKLIPLREGNWDDWYYESQQLMIVAHVPSNVTHKLKLILEHYDSSVKFDLQSSSHSYHGRR
jgi:hypothetical protein